MSYHDKEIDDPMLCDICDGSGMLYHQPHHLLPPTQEECSYCGGTGRKFVKKLIFLSGFAGSGKDTFANFILDDYLTKRKNYSAIRLAFAGHLKKVVEILFNIPYAYLYNPSLKNYIFTQEDIDSLYINPYCLNKSTRHILQFFGTDIVRHCICSEFWAQSCSSKIQEFFKNDFQNCYCIITDARYAEEVNTISKFCKDVEIYLIRIERSGIQAVNNHSSENPIQKDLLTSNIKFLEFFAPEDYSSSDYRNNARKLLNSIL